MFIVTFAQPWMEACTTPPDVMTNLVAVRWARCIAAHEIESGLAGRIRLTVDVLGRRVDVAAVLAGCEGSLPTDFGVVLIHQIRRVRSVED